MPDLETELMGCCGLNGIYNLGPFPRHDEDCDDDECEGCGDGDETNFSSIPMVVNLPDHKGILQAVTNQRQEEEGIGVALAAVGFHAVLNTLNTNSGNRITLWVKDVTEGKVPERLATAPTLPGRLLTDLLAAVAGYVQRNPNPKTEAAQNLVAAYKNFQP